jgi:hypothetical protein
MARVYQEMGVVRMLVLSIFVLEISEKDLDTPV